MEIHAINVLYDFCIMSALLFVAKILRSKIKFIQKFYIPSSLLAGVIGLFLGKYFLNVLPFSTEISSYSSILIAVLFATMFLGNKKKVSFKNMFTSVGDTFLVNAATEIFQYGIFILSMGLMRGLEYYCRPALSEVTELRPLWEPRFRTWDGMKQQALDRLLRRLV